MEKNINSGTCLRAYEDYYIYYVPTRGIRSEEIEIKSLTIIFYSESI